MAFPGTEEVFILKLQKNIQTLIITICSHSITSVCMASVCKELCAALPYSSFVTLRSKTLRVQRALGAGQKPPWLHFHRRLKDWWLESGEN